MKEIKAIVNAYDLWKSEGRKMAMAMVVKVEGSAYRREGARMLVSDHGAWVGAISGGCLEGYILEYCQQVLMDGNPLLIAYDSEKEEDRNNGIGLGCNGKVTFLIEAIDVQASDNAVELLKLVIANRNTHVLRIHFAYSEAGVSRQSSLFECDSESVFLPGDNFNEERQYLDQVLSQKRSLCFALGNETYVLYEYLLPTIQLIVAGGGNDVIPLVEMASVLGWDVTVLDRRPEFADSNRFIPSCRVVHSQVPDMLDRVTVDEHTAIALMTHNFYCDKWLLNALIHSDAFYIGQLGPRKKLERIFSELNVEGSAITLEELPQLYNPVGLDIGAKTSEEIALSMIAEIMAVRSERKGRSLKWVNMERPMTL